MVREISNVQEPGSSAFSIGLQLKDTTIITMRIGIGPDFPSSAPVVQLLTRCTHPWLSKDGYFRVVGHERLRNWNMHCNLGKVIHEVVAEFCRRPPKRIQVVNMAQMAAAATQKPKPSSVSSTPSYGIPAVNNSPLGITLSTARNASTRNELPPSYTPNPSYPTYGSVSSSDSYGGSGSISNARETTESASKFQGRSDNNEGKKQSTWAIPAVGVVDAAGNTTFPEVASLGDSRLRKLLEDDGAFQIFCQEKVAAVKTLNTTLKDLVKNNDVLARKNLGHEEKIQTLKDEVTSLRTMLKEKQTSYNRLVEKQETLSRKMSPEEFVRRIEVSVEEIDLESGELADEFVNNDFDGSLKEWTKQFMDIRKLYHKRRALISKFRYQMQNKTS